jgi:flagellar biosynthesis protein FlhG
MARIDLGACVERLTPDLSYLAARGLPLEHVDTRGTATAFLDAVANAAPRADVVLMHANPGELVRLFMRRSVRPMIVAADHPDGLKHAYAAVKLLAQRCSLMTFDLLVCAAANSPRLRHIASSLSGCADSFLGSLMRDWAVIDPASDPMQPLPAALDRLIGAQLALDDATAPVAPRLAPLRPAAALA